MFDFRRTHNCGELNISHVGKSVILSGWVNKRRDLGNLIFIDIRDKYGLTQLIFDSKISKDSHETAETLRSEFVISAKGKVIERKANMKNPNLATGEIEIEIAELAILSKAKTPPFSIFQENTSQESSLRGKPSQEKSSQEKSSQDKPSNKTEVNEELKLKYRYLDLRRGNITQKLHIRHKAILTVRNFLDSEQFTEVETPILSKTTPEGARDYLVPSRVYPSNFYALPQSPQLFKQILMISGMDKYFQIAKCFRDEDLRADRQPEFTQIDIEMSFKTQKELFALVEKMLKIVFKKCLNIDINTPFNHLSYKECIEKYGSDKPDLRFDMPLVRIDPIIDKSKCDFLKEILQKNGAIKALCVKEGIDLSRKDIEQLVSYVKPFGIDNLYSIKIKKEEISSSLTKFFTEEQLKELTTLLEAKENDLILIAAAKEDRLNQGLDHLRRHLARKRNLIPSNTYKFLWVTNFPMFSLDSKTKKIQSEHHPFTSPHFEDIALLDKEPLKIRALAYDLVLNGYEIASGSQRIHDFNLQEKVFKTLNISDEDIKIKFGYFVEALKYGTPPHLGIALGLDRLIMILTNTENIRDVIAFPKTQKASDLMTQSPSKPDDTQLKELKLKTDYEQITWN